MATNGYIKIHRKMTDWGWYKDANTKAMFLHLLLMASYEEHDFRGHTIRPGQVVCGRKQLAEDLGMSEQQVRTALEHLKTTNEITIKSTNKFSIVTIENWAKYQFLSSESTNKSTNNATNEQPTSNHIQEGKEGKNIRRGRPRKNGKGLEETYAMLEEWANDEN